MADEHEGDELAAMWTVKLQSVQRLDPDDPEDDDDTFMVEFELQSPGMNGSIEVIVPGGSNEPRMIAQAREILRAGLRRWAGVMADPPGVERAEPAGNA